MKLLLTAAAFILCLLLGAMGGFLADLFLLGREPSSPVGTNFTFISILGVPLGLLLGTAIGLILGVAVVNQIWQPPPPSASARSKGTAHRIL